jgi:hypothetical protein
MSDISGFIAQHKPLHTTAKLSTIRRAQKTDIFHVRDVHGNVPEIEEIAKYIALHGQCLNTIRVLQLGSGPYDLAVFCGNHRLAAYQEARRRGAKIDEIPVEIWKITHTEALKISIIDNIGRRAMTKVEEKMAMAAISARPEYIGKVLDDIADDMGVKPATLRNAQLLDKLVPGLYQSVVKYQTIPLSVGYALGTLPRGEQMSWGNHARDKEISSRDKIQSIRSRQRQLSSGLAPGGSGSKVVVQAAIDAAKDKPEFHGRARMKTLRDRIEAREGHPMDERARSIALNLFSILLGNTTKYNGDWNV